MDRHEGVWEFCATDRDALEKGLDVCLELSRIERRIVVVKIYDDKGRLVGRVPSLGALLSREAA